MLEVVDREAGRCGEAEELDVGAASAGVYGHPSHVAKRRLTSGTIGLTKPRMLEVGKGKHVSAVCLVYTMSASSKAVLTLL